MSPGRMVATGLALGAFCFGLAVVVVTTFAKAAPSLAGKVCKTTMGTCYRQPVAMMSGWWRFEPMDPNDHAPPIMIRVCDPTPMEQFKL